MIRQIKWSESETRLLKKIWNTPISLKEALRLFPNRTRASLYSKAKKLNFKGKIWSFRIPVLDYLPNLTLKQEDRIRLAMMIDCEGSISFSKSRDCRRYYPKVSFSNTDIKLTKLFKRLTRTKRKISEVDRDPQRKISFASSFSAMGLLYVILKQILPFLIAKRNQARLAIKFIELYDKIHKTTDLNRVERYQKGLKKIAIKVYLLNKTGRHSE